MTFITANINCQDYKLTNLALGVDPKDSVRMDQLSPVVADVQNLISGMSNYVQSAQFPALFTTAAQNADLWNGTQVNTAIAAALAGIPEAEARLGGVAVKDFVLGTLAEAQALAPTMGLTASDSNSIDDAAQSCILVVAPTIAETGLYQLHTDGTLHRLNADLFLAGLGYYTEFVAVASPTRRGRQFAVVELDSTTNQFQAVEVPYADEYMGLGPIVVSQVNKSINFRFSASDFVVDAQGEFQLHEALKQAIGQIPGLASDLNALEQVVQDLNDSLSSQIATLSQEVQALAQTVSGHTQNISGLQTSLGDALARLAQLELNALRIADFARTQEIWLYQSGNGPLMGYVKDAQNNWNPAPSNLVNVIVETTSHFEVQINHDRGVPSTPIYSYTDANGTRLKSTMFYGIEAIDDSSINLMVEKDKRVMMTFPASILGSKFA
jgi:hypothetical protein